MTQVPKIKIPIFNRYGSGDGVIGWVEVDNGKMIANFFEFHPYEMIKPILGNFTFEMIEFELDEEPPVMFKIKKLEITGWFV